MAKRSSQRRQSNQRVGEVVNKPLPSQRTWREMMDPWQIAGILVIALAIIWIYYPALNGTWLWDDDYLLENNQVVHDPVGLWNIWLMPETLIDYFPMTVTLEWLLWWIWPNNTTAFHVTNVILHTCNALIFWHLLKKLDVRMAWLGGLIFAVHPVLVESVAWMAELKNTLSMLPFLLAMCAWVAFEKSRKENYYFLALVLFLVAMLCKTSMVAFPVITLLYAWYLRGRIEWNDIKRALPFFAISIVLSLVLIALLRHGVGEETIPLGGIASRLACAGLSIAFYFSKSYLPICLTPLYPQWKINPPTPEQFIPWLIMAGVFYVLWQKRKSWGRYALLGLGFFIINVAPFVGFRAISFFRFGWTMDHILYVPILGLIGLTAAGIGDLEGKLKGPWRTALLATVAVVMIAFTVNSHKYAKTYVDQIALWSSALKLYPDGWVAHNNLGNALSAAGRTTEAEVQYLEALEINPGYPEAHNNLGIIYYQTGQPEAAITEFREALKYCPELESTQINLQRILTERQQAYLQQQGQLPAGVPPGPQ